MHGEAPNIQHEQEQDEATQQAAQRAAQATQQYTRGFLDRVFLPGNISVALPPRMDSLATREEWQALWTTMLAETTVEAGLQVSCSRGTPRNRLSL